MSHRNKRVKKCKPEYEWTDSSPQPSLNHSLLYDLRTIVEVFASQTRN